ncbi:MAG: SUMF1/EgtB/PvdO family nonheme iron enzyme [Bacteroidota bacterium]
MLKLHEPLSLATLEDHMIFIPGGVFDMGGEIWSYNAKPIHKVQISAFYLYRFQVTLGLWNEVTGSYPKEAHTKDPSKPVERVSWDDIHEQFLPALNAQSECTYRLPTEAEWEYAARGQEARPARAYSYAGSHQLSEVAWGDHNSFEEPLLVGLKRPNRLGLYDMSGNMWEWVSDWYAEGYYQSYHDQGIVSDPQGPANGKYKVARGGSGLYYDTDDFRVSARSYYLPRSRRGNFGFRLCRYLS